MSSIDIRRDSKGTRSLPTGSGPSTRVTGLHVLALAVLYFVTVLYVLTLTVLSGFDCLICSQGFEGYKELANGLWSFHKTVKAGIWL